MRSRVATMLAVAVVCLLTAAPAQVPTPPPTPGNLVATPVPGTVAAVKLTWETPAGPWLQEVYKSVDDTLHFQPIAMIPGRMFTDHQIMPGHVAYYGVTSVVMQNNGFLESAMSNVVSFSVAPPPPRPKGVISGTVVDDSTGLPIRHAQIRFFRLPSPVNMTPMAVTDSTGHYLAVLDTGVYLVKAAAMSSSPVLPPYLPEFFDNAPDPSTATPVAVAESSLFVADFGLSRVVPPTFATVTGTVTDTLGNPLRGASVVFLRPLQEGVASDALADEQKTEEPVYVEDFGYTPSVLWRGRTDSLGHYHARVVSGRSYIAMAVKLGFEPEFYNNKTSATDADVIPVNGDMTGIDFSLSHHPVAENSIGGLVRDSLGAPVPSRIALFPLRNSSVPAPWHLRYGHTDSLGTYTITHVPAGRYFVLAIPFHAYAPAFYKAGAYGVYRWQDADTVTVEGNVTGIDIGVKRIHNNGFAQIRGRVTSGDGMPLEGANVFAFTGTTIMGYALTDATGEYQLSSLPFGRMRVIVDREGYDAAESSMDVSSLSHTGVDFALSAATVLSVDEPTTPETFTLDQNYPNPFNPTTAIEFTMPAAGTATLKVYTLIGQEIATLVNGQVAAGVNRVFWNGRDAAGRSMASGLYLYRLDASAAGKKFVEMRKMVLLK
jgi:hypothetical protein